MGSAWNLRSPGLWYSSAHGAHNGNPRMLVRVRSYGSESTIVARGPQSVQLTNG